MRRKQPPRRRIQGDSTHPSDRLRTSTVIPECASFTPGASSSAASSAMTTILGTGIDRA